MASAPRRVYSPTDLVGFLRLVCLPEPGKSRTAPVSRHYAKAILGQSGGLVDSGEAAPTGEHYVATNGMRVRLANREAQTVRGPPVGRGKRTGAARPMTAYQGVKEGL